MSYDKVVMDAHVLKAPHIHRLNDADSKFPHPRRVFVFYWPWVG